MRQGEEHEEMCPAGRMGHLETGQPSRKLTLALKSMAAVAHVFSDPVLQVLVHAPRPSAQVTARSLVCVPEWSTPRS